MVQVKVTIYWCDYLVFNRYATSRRGPLDAIRDIHAWTTVGTNFVSRYLYVDQPGQFPFHDIQTGTSTSCVLRLDHSLDDPAQAGVRETHRMRWPSKPQIEDE
jgi:hypothetical protein